MGEWLFARSTLTCYYTSHLYSFIKSRFSIVRISRSSQYCYKLPVFTTICHFHNHHYALFDQSRPTHLCIDNNTSKKLRLFYLSALIDSSSADLHSFPRPRAPYSLPYIRITYSSSSSHHLPVRHDSRVCACLYRQLASPVDWF